jgi:hypothetical protein
VEEDKEEIRGGSSPPDPLDGKFMEGFMHKDEFAVSNVDGFML